MNKVSSRVELEFNVKTSSAFTEEQKARIVSSLGRSISSDGTLRVRCQASRSQWKNRVEAERKLLLILAAALAPVKNRRATRPTAASKARRIEAKKLTGWRKRLRKAPPADGN